MRFTNAKQYDPWAYAALLVACSVADHYHTVTLLAAGISLEMNPVMDFVLQQWPIVALTIKTLMTAAAGSVLAYQRRIGWLRALSGVYAAVLAYQAYLLLTN